MRSGLPLVSPRKYLLYVTIVDITPLLPLLISQSLIPAFQEAANVQDLFASETESTMYHILPTFQGFFNRWEAMADDTRFELVEPALRKGLGMIEKYYNLTDRSAASIVCLGALLRFTDTFLVYSHYNAQFLIPP